jgi:glycosyltransferase involved in cell wall biosynthesis
MPLYPWIQLKRYIEQVIMFPFVLAGKLVARLNPLPEKEYDLFCFFPIYGLGGAEKVHASVLRAVPDKKVIVFFTRKSDEVEMKRFFTLPHVTIKDISRYTDNKWLYGFNFLYRGICAQYINQQDHAPTVFNGQCNFAYKLFPHIRKNILKTELIHNAEKRFGWITFPYIPVIDKRAMITQLIIDQHINYYRELGIPSLYDSRITQIQNTVPVPKQYTVHSPGDTLKVYYAGRSGWPKRLYLILEIARKALAAQLPIEFHFAGNFESEIPADIRPHIHWHGLITDEKSMYDLHKQMDVLIMTSAFEGFPLSIMEAMSCGVAIVSTAVDGIRGNIIDGVAGLLIHETEEEAIVTSGLEKLKRLSADRELLQQISRNNYEYAVTHFSEAKFNKAYRDLFNFKD